MENCKVKNETKTIPTINILEIATVTLEKLKYKANIKIKNSNVAVTVAPVIIKRSFAYGSFLKIRLIVNIVKTTRKKNTKTIRPIIYPFTLAHNIVMSSLMG